MFIRIQDQKQLDYGQEDGEKIKIYLPISVDRS
jgi:hypothetical protein